MANRYWVGGTANWDNNVGTKWATTSGGGGGVAVPTSADDVFFDGASGTVVCTIANQVASCKTLTCTGFTGTLAGVTFSLDIYGNLTLGAAMTYTQTPTTFKAASGTVTITSNGVKMAGVTLTLGANYVIADNLDTTGRSINDGMSFSLTNGTFDAQNHNVTSGRYEDDSTTGTSVITMGSGTWSVIGPGTVGGFRLGTVATLNANTSTVKFTNTGATDVDLTCYSKTLYNVWFSRGASTNSITINGGGVGSPTFNDFKDDGTGAHAIKFLHGQTFTFTSFTVSGTPTANITIQSDTAATHTLSKASGTVTSRHLTITNSLAGGGATWNATDSTDSGGNTGWNFLFGDRYWVGGAATWDGTAGSKWASTSGGTAGETAPSANNNVYLDAGSGAVTVTIGASVTSKNFTLTGFTGTLAGSSAIAVSGNFVSAATFTFTYSGTMTFSQTSSITTALSTIACPIVLDGVGKTFSLVDALVSSSSVNLTNGTFNLTNFNATIASFSSSNANTRVLTLGSGTLEVNGTGTVFNVATTTGLTINANTSTIKLTNSSSSSKTFAGGGKTFNNFWNATGSTGVTIITGSNTFNDFRSSGDSRTIQFTAGTTTTFTTLTVTGIAFTLTSVTSATHTLSCVSGTITIQNATISYSIATGGATFKAPTTYSNVDGGNNTGWIFTPLSTSPMLLLLDSIV